MIGDFRHDQCVEQLVDFVSKGCRSLLQIQHYGDAAGTIFQNSQVISSNEVLNCHQFACQTVRTWVGP